MTDNPSEWLVLEDDAGDYYLLDRRLLAASRVPPERVALIDRLLAEADTVGFAAPAAASVLNGMLRARGVLRAGDRRRP